MLIDREKAIAAVESAIRYTFDGCCLNTAYAATEALRALPTVSVTDDEIERIALQNAKEYLQGAGPWKLDEIGITPDDYLVKCFTKAIREAALGATVSDGWEDIATDKLDAWRFNVMLECQGGTGECVIGGAELNLNDLLAILDFVSDRCPLPATPTID